MTGAVFTHTYTNLNIPQIIGSTTAYVGFTGGTGGETAIQDILNWSARFMDPVQPVNHFNFAGSASIVAGSPVSVTVSARDGFNNLKNDYRGTVTINVSDPQGSFPVVYTFTAADNGSHTFSGIFRTAGSQSITITDAVTSYIAGVDAITVTPAAASVFIVTGFPNSVAGTSGTFTVTARDVYGNTATGYSGTVTFTSTDPQAALPADSSLANGVGTFTATLFTAGSRSITARDTASGTLAGTQSGILISPAAVDHFLVADYPTSSDAGDLHTYGIFAKDPYGNTNPNYVGTVTFSSTDPRAVLEDPYTFTAADQGVHFSGAIFYTAGLQNLNATDGTGTIVGSQVGINVLPLAASSLVITGYPSPVRPGVPSIITVFAIDIYGNVAPTYTGRIRFTTSDAAGFVPPDYTFTAADVGVHQFAAVLVTPGLQSIVATDIATGTIVGEQDVLVVAPATHIMLSAPSEVTAGFFSVTVSLVDDNGNLDVLYTGTVHFSTSDPLGILPPDYTFTAADGGTATFQIGLGTSGEQELDVTDGTLMDSAFILVDALRPGGGDIVGHGGLNTTHDSADGSTNAPPTQTQSLQSDDASDQATLAQASPLTANRHAPLVAPLDFALGNGDAFSGNPALDPLLAG